MDDLYARLLTSCPGLVEIKAHRVSQKIVQKLGSTAGSTLRVIDLRMTNASSGCLDLLFKCCSRLVSLTLSEGYHNMTGSTARSLVDHCPLVERLDFTGWGGLNDLSLAIISSLLYLRELRLTYGLGLTWSGVQEFVKNSPKLEVLHVKIYEGSVDELLRCLSLFCPRLRAFHCYKNAVTHDAVVALLQGCPLLEEVVIDEYCPNDTVLCAVAECCPNMSVFRFGLPKPGFISDRGLIALSRGCPYLTELCLYCRDPVTDDAILSIAEHCHELADFTLSCNETITSRSVCALIKANPGLTRVSISHYRRIDDDQCLVALASCPKLKRVDLCGISQVSQSSFELFVNGCQYLEMVELCYSDITDATIDVMARRCRRLKDVVLGLCPQVTERSVLSILTHSKRLNSIHAASCNIVITNELRDRLDSLTLPGPSQRRLSVHINSESWRIFPENN